MEADNQSEEEVDIDNSQASSSEETIVKKVPKKIIGDLFNKILEEIPTRLNKEIFFSLIKSLEQSLNEKHILFYFDDQELQSKVEELGWDGRVKSTAWDYLMVVNTNIAGGKSDRKIKEEIQHTSEVQEDGTIIDTVIIKRKHTAIRGDEFTGVRNVDWMRIYVPLGSELIETLGFTRPDEGYFEKPASWWEKDPDVVKSENKGRIDIESGTKIYEDGDKTVFANWSMVEPEETTTIYLKYLLPFRLNEIEQDENIFNKIKSYLNPTQKQLIPYALLAQKQPGSIGSEINSTLKLPFNMETVWQYPAKINVSTNGWQINDQLNIDRFWAVLVAQN